MPLLICILFILSYSLNLLILVKRHFFLSHSLFEKWLCQILSSFFWRLCSDGSLLLEMHYYNLINCDPSKFISWILIAFLQLFFGSSMYMIHVISESSAPSPVNVLFCFFFFSLVLLHWLGMLIQCWIETFALVLILGRKYSVFYC